MPPLVWFPLVLAAFILIVGIPVARLLYRDNRAFATALVVLLVLGGVLPNAVVNGFGLPVYASYIITAVVILAGMPFILKRWPPVRR